jgi:hypothetical protein
MSDKEDDVTNPKHYRMWEIEPADYIMKNQFEFWRGNIVKYASRAGFKKYPNKNYPESEILDLRKIIEYAEMRIEQIHYDYYCGRGEYKDEGCS